jgi:hypothetical protein
MFKRYLIPACSILLWTWLNVPALAQDRPQDYDGALKAACGKEINDQCRGVQDARGQLLACLYWQEASLSPSCEGTLWNTMSRLDKTLVKVEQVQRDCDRDKRQWCKEVTADGGHFVACLLRSQQMVSAECKAIVYSIWDKKRNRG